MKVNICGIPHTIIYKKEELIFNNDDARLGVINHKHNEILINEDMSPAMQEETLCHEVLHGILTHIGRDDLSSDEQLVQCLANAIFQTFDLRLEDTE